MAVMVGTAVWGLNLTPELGSLTTGAHLPETSSPWHQSL